VGSQVERKAERRNIERFSAGGHEEHWASPTKDGIPVEAELGCGQDKPDHRLGVDKVETEDVDVVEDLDSKEWSLPENHFEYVRCKDLFEHLENPVQFVENLYDVIAPGGVVEIRSPHLSSQNWTDPTHKRMVGIQTFDLYFTEKGKYTYYSSAEFEVFERRIEFPKRKVQFYNYLLEPLVNYSDSTQRIFENSILSSFFQASNVFFKLKKSGGGRS